LSKIVKIEKNPACIHARNKALRTDKAPLFSVRKIAICSEAKRKTRKFIEVKPIIIMEEKCCLAITAHQFQFFTP
jgi:hypothetical protein